MADFYPVLSRAITALQDPTPEARRAIYDRAKQVLVAQLRGMDPPVSEAEIMRQRLALDDVIARIERERMPALDEPDALPPIEERPEPSHQRPVVPRPESDGTADDLPDPPAQPDRPRLDITGPKQRRQIPWAKLVVAGGVLLAVGAIGTTAYYVNRDNRDIVATAPGVARPQPATPGEGPKITDRVGADGQPAPAQPSTPAQPASPGVAPPRTDIAVAQRAVLYVEPADTNQPPRAVVGRVAWRVEAQNAGQGQPLETVIRADAEVAEAGLQLIFTIRRNTDVAFPASHIVGMRFVRTQDDGNGAVVEAGVPQFKAEENERGAPLSAITSALGNGLFVSALSRVPVEVERNVELIRTRNWVDIPVRFASGRRGIIAFEKGLSGDQRIAEGFAAWR